MKKERSIRVEIKSSMNVATPEVIRADIQALQESRQRAKAAIKRNLDTIREQRAEQENLRMLAEDPGIYNADACRAAADRCDKHIRSFEALNEKERAKMEQLGSMIATLEKRLWLSETTSQ